MTYKVKSLYKESKGTQNIREPMAKLPFQHFITWFTGKPIKGQRPLFKRTGGSHILTAYFTLISGVIISIFAGHFGLWLLYPIGWLLTVSGARKLITTINHYCVHKALFKKKRYDYIYSLIADFNSSLLFLQSFSDYKKEHLTHHGEKVVGSIHDPDMVFLWHLGFKPGMSLATLKNVLAFNLFVPYSRLHRMFLTSRFQTSLYKGNMLRYSLQLLVITALIYLAVITSPWIVFFSFIFPMTYVYHIAAMLQFSTEHLWLKDVDANGLLKGMSPKALKERSQCITVARFSGEAIPQKSVSLLMNIKNWMYWLFKMLFVHLPFRLFVVPGDFPTHDWHHRVSEREEWPNALFARQKAVENLSESEPPYKEVAGRGPPTGRPARSPWPLLRR